MTTQDFPPYLPEDDDDRTVMIPRPGGRGNRRRQSNRTTASPQSPLAIFNTGINKLASAAAPLLNLMAKLSQTAEHQNVNQLREQLLQEIKQFQQTTRTQGVDHDTAYTAAYLLCAAIDEAVLNTIWGADSLWSHQGLLSTLYKQTSGGERFFAIIGQLMQDPQGDLDLMELAYICISLGFQGRYRPMPDGATKLEQVRHRLFEQIRRRRGEFPRELSVRWQNQNSQGKALRKLLPLWVVAAVAGALLLSIFLGFSLVLENQSDPVFERLEQLAK